MTGRVLDADVGVVGAGPGGLAAATALAQAGLSVVVLDEGARAGGQIFRQLPTGADGHGVLAEPPSHARGGALLAQLARSRVVVRGEATVWRGAPGRLWFEQRGESWLLRCGQIVLAPGAYDRCMPFPGWTLPGVITAGAAQVMVRGFGVKPGQRALVAGSGPLLLPTVTALVSAGVQVVGALEAAPRRAALRALPGVFGSGARLREAFWYARQLLRAGIRLRFGHTVFACDGDGRVQRAIVGRVDGEGRPLRSTATAVEVDVVCVGFGLVPSVELAAGLGCKLVHRAERGGWSVVVDERQRTDVPGVFAAGEICGIGGAEVAIAEGELAAAAILAERQGVPVPQRCVVRQRAQRRAADAMLRAFPNLPGLVGLADDSTIVCRCEDVSLATARAAAALHGTSAKAIKVGCRAGMGPCQGRICAPSLQALATGDGTVVMDAPAVQVPWKPVRTRTIVDAPAG